jgi:hypothetical protein
MPFLPTWITDALFRRVFGLGRAAPARLGAPSTATVGT